MKCMRLEQVSDGKFEIIYISNSINFFSTYFAVRFYFTIHMLRFRINVLELNRFEC